MQARIWGIAGLMVGLLPNLGNAQVYQFATPPPPVTAQYAEWQFNDDAIIVNSLVYYPTRETRFFDGKIMAQVAVFRSVPVYADVTLEPHSVIYIPVGRTLMRGYERRREGELAGTQGSRTPAFPVEVATALTTTREPILIAAADFTPVSAPAIPAPVLEIARPATARPGPPPRLESARRPTETSGIWIIYEGSRWYSGGPAVEFSAQRFTPIGDYYGFPVYCDKDGRADRIWVQVRPEGPLAPYTRR